MFPVDTLGASAVTVPKRTGPNKALLFSEDQADRFVSTTPRFAAQSSSKSKPSFWETVYESAFGQGPWYRNLGGILKLPFVLIFQAVQRLFGGQNTPKTKVPKQPDTSRVHQSGVQSADNAPASPVASGNTVTQEIDVAVDKPTIELPPQDTLPEPKRMTDEEALERAKTTGIRGRSGSLKSDTLMFGDLVGELSHHADQHGAFPFELMVTFEETPQGERILSLYDKPTRMEIGHIAGLNGTTRLGSFSRFWTLLFPGARTPHGPS